MGIEGLDAVGGSPAEPDAAPDDPDLEPVPEEDVMSPEEAAADDTVDDKETLEEPAELEEEEN